MNVDRDETARTGAIGGASEREREREGNSGREQDKGSGIEKCRGAAIHDRKKLENVARPRKLRAIDPAKSCRHARSRCITSERERERDRCENFATSRGMPRERPREEQEGGNRREREGTKQSRRRLCRGEKVRHGAARRKGKLTVAERAARNAMVARRGAGRRAGTTQRLRLGAGTRGN